MSNQIKNGRKPLSSKPAQTQVFEEDIFGNALAMDPALKVELQEQGLEWRFVDRKQLTDMGGYHKRGWQAYKRRGHATMDKQEFVFGSSPDGYIYRGSLVLAVRPISVGDKHRAVLAQRADRYKQVNKTAAKELKQKANEAGLDVEIHEGYEENDTD